jgi:nitrogen regulatory protein P-II 2
LCRILPKSKLESQQGCRYLENMKRIEAIIRPHLLADTLVALSELQVTGVTVTETLGLGRQPGHSEIYEEIHRYPGLEMGLVPKKSLVVFVEDDCVRAVVDTISRVARTGRYGDGRVAVSHLDELQHIHNGGE